MLYMSITVDDVLTEGHPPHILVDCSFTVGHHWISCVFSSFHLFEQVFSLFFVHHNDVKQEVFVLIFIGTNASLSCIVHLIKLKSDRAYILPFRGKFSESQQPVVKRDAGP